MKAFNNRDYSSVPNEPLKDQIGFFSKVLNDEELISEIRNDLSCAIKEMIVEEPSFILKEPDDVVGQNDLLARRNKISNQNKSEAEETPIVEAAKLIMSTNALLNLRPGNKRTNSALLSAFYYTSMLKHDDSSLRSSD